MHICTNYLHTNVLGARIVRCSVVHWVLTSVLPLKVLYLLVEVGKRLGVLALQESDGALRVLQLAPHLGQHGAGLRDGSWRSATRGGKGW